MKISGLYSYDNSNISEYLKIDAGAESIGDLNAGEIIEGIVTSADTSTKVSFEKLNNREISFDRTGLRDASVGQKRNFQVVEAGPERLVLKDLGEAGAEIAARGVLAAKVNLSMPQMVDDFSETMDDMDEDSCSIERMSDEDYQDLTEELFSIEDYKAERLVRALARIKSNRAALEKSIEEQGTRLKEERKSIRHHAARAAAEKYNASLELVESLVRADLPLTRDNILGLQSAVTMSAETARMTDNSYAFLIGGELEPTVGNIYKAVYSGTVHRTYLSDEDWRKLAPAAMEIVNDAAAEQEHQADTAAVALSDAKWMLEYDIPLNRENLIYKKELEKLKNELPDEKFITEAAAAAINRGKEATDAIMIASHEPGERDSRKESAEQLTAQLRLQEIRLAMAMGSTSKSGNDGTGAAVSDSLDSIRFEVEQLRSRLKQVYLELAGEFEIDSENGEDADRASELAIDTGLAVKDISEAGPELYGRLAERFGGVAAATRVSLEVMGETARQAVIPEMTGEAAGQAGIRNYPDAENTDYQNDRFANLILNRSAAGSYESSATEIRPDLGDSISKAFWGIDSFLENAGLELTEANRRAVRILGRNAMEITSRSVEEIKYFDSKVSTMIGRLKPAVVMAMIKRGYNPLEQDVDTINREIDEIVREEGIGPEERFSSFLAKLEMNGNITDEARAAYIGIYRLLYQIEKNDGACIGAAVNSGKKLTLANLLTEARTGNLTAGAGIDARIDDSTSVQAMHYENSISEQIEYNIRLAREISHITEPEVWNEAFEGAATEEMTLEQVAEQLKQADCYINDNEAASEVRAVMLAGGAVPGFLKSLGIKDSVRNIRILNNESEDLSLKLESADDLLESLENAKVQGEKALAERFEEAEELARRKLEEEFLGNIAILTRGRELKEQLDRCGLMKQMANQGHYRMSTGGDNPARINLTVIRDAARAGSVRLEISTSSYHVRADLNLTLFEGQAAEPAVPLGRIDGRICCESNSELQAVEAELTSFVGKMKSIGYDTDGIVTGIDRISPDRYLSRLGEMKRRAAADTTAVEQKDRRHVSTSRLYDIAREFVAIML